MTDEPRDELDRALASSLGAMAPDVDDADATLSTMRPRFQRARTRHRVMQTSIVVAVVLVVGAIAALAAPGTRRGSVQVSTSSTTDTERRTSTVPSTATPKTVPTTAGPAASTPTTQGNNGQAPPNTSVRTPASTPTAAPPATGGPAPTTPVASDQVKTYHSTGGDMTVRFSGGALHLVSHSAAAGFTAEVHTQKPDDVEVRFNNGNTEWRIRVRVDNGKLQPAEITEH
jgi:hypothetical protein